jgi:hypothetical protein
MTFHCGKKKRIMDFNVVSLERFLEKSKNAKSKKEMKKIYLKMLFEEKMKRYE